MMAGRRSPRADGPSDPSRNASIEKTQEIRRSKVQVYTDFLNVAEVIREGRERELRESFWESGT